MPDDIDTPPPAPGLAANAAPRPALPPPLGWRLGASHYGLIRMSLLAFIVGAVTGLGAFLFRELIGLVHNLLFLKTFAFAYDSSLFTASNPWGALVILVPVVGAIGVTFIVSTFAPEAKGHGVPEVMDAIYYQGGVIRPVVAVAKSLASALAIGSGAAVGREGPIIQIGSALGSTLGQLISDEPGPAHHPRCRGRRRRDRGDLQHPDRRGAVRDRADAARGQRQHLPAGRGRDRDGDVHRPPVLRPATGLSCADDRAACPVLRPPAP